MNIDFQVNIHIEKPHGENSRPLGEPVTWHID